MKRNEIGSEFWDVPTKENRNCFFPKSTQWFLSGRSALQAIIKELKKNTCSVAMPSWCCDSMVKPFTEAGIDIYFYPTYWQKQDGFVKRINLDCDVLFLMDYFGYTSQVSDLSSYAGVIVRDVTQSIFSFPYSDADYYFGSLRKWCGMWTGGYAWTRDGHILATGQSDDFGYVTLRKEAMQLKNAYISGYVDNNGNKVTDKLYLNIYNAAEESLENAGIAPAEKRDVWMAQRLDVEFIKSRRRANAKILRAAFSDCLIFSDLKDTDCPMFVPIFVPDGKRDRLRQYLINNDIYCPIHWPISKYHRLNEKERCLYTNELSLVCDQRYTEEDMYRIVGTIEKFWKEA